jgi:hypothetical protein
MGDLTHGIVYPRSTRPDSERQPPNASGIYHVHSGERKLFEVEQMPMAL